MKIIDYLIYTILILLSLSILNLYIICMCIVDIYFHTIKSILTPPTKNFVILLFKYEIALKIIVYSLLPML